MRACWVLPAAGMAMAVVWGATGGVSAAGDEDFRGDVDRRVQQWQPTEAERRVDQIAWVSDIRTALRLGNESRRPIFLFTHDGRLGTGRQ
jgi:hypothetical protein